MTNHRYIQEFNKKSSFKLGLNKFAAMTPAEYKSLLNVKMPIPKQISQITKLNNDIPESIDYRDLHVVGPVQDQGATGSSPKIQVTCSCESNYALAHENRLTLFSIASLRDCYNGEFDSIEFIFEWIMSTWKGKLMADEDYKSSGGCDYKSEKAIYKITGYQYLRSEDEDTLKMTVATHGITVATIDAGQASFQFYSSGIYDEPKCTKVLNHVVAVVGYGSENNIDYWICKNSWGTFWGEDGYLRMVRNKSNQCGIASKNAVATV